MQTCSLPDIVYGRWNDDPFSSVGALLALVADGSVLAKCGDSTFCRLKKVNVCTPNNLRRASSQMIWRPSSGACNAFVLTYWIIRRVTSVLSGTAGLRSDADELWPGRDIPSDTPLTGPTSPRRHRRPIRSLCSQRTTTRRRTRGRHDHPPSVQDAHYHTLSGRHT